MTDRHRIVILGGGFAGLNAAQSLRNAPADVTVVDRRNFHLFQPLLYQVATGSLSPGEIASPLRAILKKQKNTRVLLGDVVDIDVQARIVRLDDGGTIPFDSLIVATGSRSTYFGHDEWREWAPSLKSVEEATTIRHKILLAFETAERMAACPERQDWLTFVIVGAGATGVELAGALAEIARHTLRSEFRAINPSSEARIIVLDGALRILTAFPEDLAQIAERSLVRMGVEVRCGVKVVDVGPDGVMYQAKDGSTRQLRAKTVLWGAGVAASELGKLVAQRTGAEVDRSGKVKVKTDLTLPGHPEMFVVGDLAYVLDTRGKPLPGVAQVAMQGGRFAAQTIVRRLRGDTQVKAFRYFNKGDLAVIGRASAIANLFERIHLSGLMAWLVWLFIHLMYIVRFESRIQVFIQWGFEYLTYSHGARLITWSTTSEPATNRAQAKEAIQLL